jgi:hypothetical protein
LIERSLAAFNAAAAADEATAQAAQ